MREVLFLDKHTFLCLCPETFANFFFFLETFESLQHCSGFDTGKDMQFLVHTGNTPVVVLEEKWWLL